MLLMIDNYDSFTYNLVHYFEMLGQDVHLAHNDQITLKKIKALKPTHLVISPGPKNPKHAGISLEAIGYFHQSIPILGVCLGHQCLAQFFGANIIQAPEIFHGRTSKIFHNKQALFENTPSPFIAARYHSLTIDPDTLPDCFRIDGWTHDAIMAITHRKYPLFGLQFHPEAILTEQGLSLLNQFLKQSI